MNAKKPQYHRNISKIVLLYYPARVYKVIYVFKIYKCSHLCFSSLKNHLNTSIKLLQGNKPFYVIPEEVGEIHGKFLFKCAHKVRAYSHTSAFCILLRLPHLFKYFKLSGSIHHAKGEPEDDTQIKGDDVSKTGNTSDLISKA